MIVHIPTNLARAAGEARVPGGNRAAHNDCSADEGGI
jgi:hypothetical protein